MWVRTNTKTSELVNLTEYQILRIESGAVVARSEEEHAVLFHGDPARCQGVFNALMDGLAAGNPFYDTTTMT